MITTNHQRGFTIIEVLITTFVLVVGFVPLLRLGTQSIDLSTSIRNNLIAANLAQEGIEVIRAIRDDNWFDNHTFSQGLYPGCTAGCRVQWDSTSRMQLSGNPPLRFDYATGIYSYSSGANTPFRRMITITRPSSVEMQVTSTVTWNEGTHARSVSVESHLFDWF